MRCLGLYRIAAVGSLRTQNLRDSPSQSVVILYSWTAVDWLISQKLVLLSLLATVAVNQSLGRTFPLSCLCESLLSGRAAEALLRIGQREKPVTRSYWPVCQ